MGKINVKIANNYAPTPQQAADQYAQQNRTNNFMFPPVKQWIANPNIDLMHGFGMAAELADGSAIVGLSVCHLKNQQTGVEQLLLKTMDILEKEGKITADERSNFNLAIKREVDGSALINQLFIDAAIYTTDRMNKIGNSDIDFSYQFNPSAVQGLEPKFTNLISGLGFKNAELGATMPSVASGSTETEYTSPIGSSDEYLLPGWYGILRSYVRGNVQSFFQADSTYQEIGGGGNSEDVAKALDAVFNEQSDAIANCTDKQATLYDEQQQAIEERTEKLAEEIEAAAKAAAEAAKKSSGPSYVIAEEGGAADLNNNAAYNKYWSRYISEVQSGNALGNFLLSEVRDTMGFSGTPEIVDGPDFDGESTRYAYHGGSATLTGAQLDEASARITKAIEKFENTA